jgi:hypothetical protein
MQIEWVNPDRGFRMNILPIADRKTAPLVKVRDLFLGRG